MMDAATRARIRRLFYAEHWRIGTISAELGVHHDTVRHAVEVDRFVNTRFHGRPAMLDLPWSGPLRGHRIVTSDRLTWWTLFATAK